MPCFGRAPHSRSRGGPTLSRWTTTETLLSRAVLGRHRMAWFAGSHGDSRCPGWCGSCQGTQRGRPMIRRWSGALRGWRRGLCSVFAPHRSSDVGRGRPLPYRGRRGGNTTGRPPLSTRRAGSACHRDSLGPRLPRRHTALHRRLRRYRRLLRDLRVRDHRGAAPRARGDGQHVARRLLRPPGAAHHPGGDLVIIVTVIGSLPLTGHADRARDRHRTASGPLCSSPTSTSSGPDELPGLPAATLAALNYWSLGVEEQFYIVYPARLLAHGSAGAPRVSSGCASASSSSPSSSVSYGYSIVFTSSNAQSAFFSLLVRSWELALGGLIAVYGQQLQRIPQAWAAVASWVGLAVILVASVTLTPAACTRGRWWPSRRSAPASSSRPVRPHPRGASSACCGANRSRSSRSSPFRSTCGIGRSSRSPPRVAG